MIARYTTAEMAALWSDESRYQTWLTVELAACRAMENAGIVPRNTASEIAAKATLNPTRIAEIETKVRHDVIAFLTHVEEQAGAPARWLHLGLTSSDVLDTALAITLRQAGELLLRSMDRLLDALKRRALETKTLAMVGRSHGIHAEPVTVGVFLAGCHAELKRNRVRLERAIVDVSVGKIAGAVGVYSNLSPDIEAQTLGELGLQAETAATQVVARDRHAAYFSALALVAAGLERLAVQVRHWQRTEVGEASEPFERGQKGSSAMPHKRNPIQSENMCGLARLVRGMVSPALEDIALWHERDISHSSVERVIGPDATTLLHFMIERMTRLVDGLIFSQPRLAANLDLTGGLIFSEAILLALVRKGLPRQQAYELVQKQALAAQDGRGSFRELLGQSAEIKQKLSAKELGECFDLDHHLRHIDVIFQRAFRD